MVGIVSFGAYVPRYRLSRAAIAREWGRGGGAGTRSVANHDEDSLTMALEASLSALEGLPQRPQRVYLATTTSPYAEKAAAGLVATVLDLPRDAFTADYGGSLRAGTGALRSALEAVQGGAPSPVLVAASDCRLAEPGSDLEGVLGDGAAALLVGRDGVIAELEAYHSLSGDFTDTWRNEGEPYLQRGDPAFIGAYGLQTAVRECVQALLKNAGLKPEDVSAAAISGPDQRAQARVAKGLGMGDRVQASDAIWAEAGDTGCSLPLLQLAAILEVAGPGDRVLVCGYGGGSCDAFVFRVTEEIRRLAERRAVGYCLAHRRELASYGKYLQFRKILAAEPLAPYSSLALSWRETRQDLQLYGVRCRECGAMAYPRRRVCLSCGTKDHFDDEKLSRRGTVFTFTRDHLFPSPESPIAMIVAEMEGGGRFYGQFTDADPREVRIGMAVELAFRRLHEGGGVVHYFWKFRPAEAGSRV
ncbi:MAG TPA: OB-fold domain-containing protein [Dehalococcoidia bacterium]|nr:OB-fold domain-containing protein [Dehalococcoidia bacterium]